MEVRYRVDLTMDERNELCGMLQKGSTSARRIKRAQILLAADEGQGSNAIARVLHVSESTVLRTKKRFVEGNLERALTEEPRPGARRKLSGKEEALLIATVCSKAPQGCARWTLELLAGRMVELTEHEKISTETIRRRLKDNHLKPWQRKMWCIPEVNAEYVARLEDILDLYTAEEGKRAPVVCFDETPQQLIGMVRPPWSVRPGSVEKIDYEYQRNGTVNLFVFADAHRPWRHVKVTANRKFADFAECMRELVDEYYPTSPKIRVVLDNLSTHSASGLYQSFAPEEARRILKRIEFHYVPKHASWLNMVEIEIGVLKKQCLGQRIGERGHLEAEIRAWENRRNHRQEKIDWLFTKETARLKMRKAYPILAQQPETAKKPA